MLTTQALINAALARGLREKLPGEWWRQGIVCPSCKKADRVEKVEDRYQRYSCDCGTNFSRKDDSEYSEVLDYPDLTAPANLYELLRFADAVGSGHCSINPYLEVDGEWFFSAHIWRRGTVADVADSFNGNGPDRTTAVLAACAKALGVEGAG